MKNNKTSFRITITNDTFISGEHVKAGTTVEVGGEDAFLLVANNKGRMASEDAGKATSKK